MVLRITLILSIFAIAWVGAPSFISAVWMSVGEPIVKDMRAGKAATDVELETLIETRESASSVSGWSDAYADLAYAYLVQDIDPANAQRVLEAGRKSVEANPMSPYTWQRYAALHSFYAEHRKDSVETWRTARALGNNVRFLVLDRIRIGTAIYREMNNDDRALLREDALWAYQLNKGQVHAYGQQHGLLEWFKFLLRDAEKTRFLNS